MANKLKKIFSNDTPEYKSTLKFKDSVAYRSFHAALETVEKEGGSVPIEGVASIITYMNLHGVQFPIDKSEHVSELVIAPAKKHVSLPVEWEEQKKIYNFESFRIVDGIVLETEKNAVVYMKLLISENLQKVKITYEFQYQYAKTLSELKFEIDASIAFFKKFYEPTLKMGSTEELQKIEEVFHYLKCSSAFVLRLSMVENVLGVSIQPEMLESISEEEQKDIEELYLLLCEKQPLKLNARIDSTNGANIEISDLQEELMIGKEIALVFVREVLYELFGQKFSIFTANVFINAIIREIQQHGNKMTVFYGDTDSRPMYLAYSGFLTEREAEIEISRNIANEPAYINAQVSAQYIKEFYKVSNI